LVQSKAIAQSIQELESVLGGRLQELAINALVFTHSGGDCTQKLAPLCCFVSFWAA
jgi:hypothetical protein